ncbi:type II toxin-antitoxin system PemK/MazF family toxin [Sphingomonas bacterium]|uniref:type II toxin-antitoxin system PemK/MazF family toxin n=1 Tax=Sphingomonas bacterium TaxID=1895847 RepID=UPI001C2D07B9|nr:type II toxin-antitoxin system PemK/MazF family toxin [Sphingomonas bacterium]
MSLPTPEPGLVIPYAYLWRHEHRKGQEEGRKVRPSVIVLAVQNSKGGAPRVTVAPITHTPPAKDGEAIELPPRVKQALGLDDDRSWIVLDEVNQFAWPGYDIRPVPGSKTVSLTASSRRGCTTRSSVGSSNWPLCGAWWRSGATNQFDRRPSGDRRRVH